MVLATEIMLPPRRNSYAAPETPASKSPPKHGWWFFTSKIKSSDAYGGSGHVATQKLRESKWFLQDEERLVCAVVESGFIVELMLMNLQDKIVNNNNNFNNNNGIEVKTHYGIVSVEVKKKDKKPTASDILVFTVTKIENRLKVVKFTVAELWSQGYKIRINNLNDKTKHINSEKEIKSQINYAMKHKSVFHNSLHFVDHCRYGNQQLQERTRQVSESCKYGNVGITAGILLLQRERSNSYSK